MSDSTQTNQHIVIDAVDGTRGPFLVIGKGHGITHGTIDGLRWEVGTIETRPDFVPFSVSHLHGGKTIDDFADITIIDTKFRPMRYLASAGQNIQAALDEAIAFAFRNKVKEPFAFQSRSANGGMNYLGLPVNQQGQLSLLYRQHTPPNIDFMIQLAAQPGESKQEHKNRIYANIMKDDPSKVFQETEFGYFRAQDGIYIIKADHPADKGIREAVYLAYRGNMEVTVSLGCGEYLPAISPKFETKREIDQQKRDVVASFAMIESLYPLSQQRGHLDPSYRHYIQGTEQPIGDALREAEECSRLLNRNVTIRLNHDGIYDPSSRCYTPGTRQSLQVAAVEAFELACESSSDTDFYFRCPNGTLISYRSHHVFDNFLPKVLATANRKAGKDLRQDFANTPSPTSITITETNSSITNMPVSGVVATGLAGGQNPSSEAFRVAVNGGSSPLSAKGGERKEVEPRGQVLQLKR